MKAKHLVLAIGGLGAVPHIPNLRNKVCPSSDFFMKDANVSGQELYKGEIMHSISYKSAHKWRGKTGIVVGSANTGTLSYFYITTRV